MESRPLGTTGLQVTPIGLGLAAIGRPAYLTAGRREDLGDDRSYAALQRRSHELLDAAHEAGIRYFDVARSYGAAETFLGEWLKGRAGPDVVVGSKWGYTYTGGWRMDADVHEVKDHTVAALRRQLKESRTILGDRMSLYQIHSATIESGVLEDREVLAELAGLSTEGIVVGLSVSGPRQDQTIRRALEVEVGGVDPFGSVQATWNVLEPSAGGALAEARAAGLGVIVKEAVANGRLTDNGTGPELRALRRLATRHGTSTDAVAMAAVLAQPWCDVVLSGAATPQQLRSNLGSLDVVLTEDDLEELAGIAEAPESYWAQRGARPWT